MKYFHFIFSACVMISANLTAEEKSAEPTTAVDPLVQHQEGAMQIAEEQDQLSADVEQLVAEQTIPKVIELLGGVENIMDEAGENLSKADTGGNTLAAQTEVIEKIHAAAKEKQSQGGQSPSGGAMMEMMERMMGKNPDGEKPGKGKGEQPGQQSGEGMTGSSDTANQATGGDSNGKNEARRVPKAAGKTGAEIPEEFKKAFEAYNRGVEKKLK